MCPLFSRPLEALAPPPASLWKPLVNSSNCQRGVGAIAGIGRRLLHAPKGSDCTVTGAMSHSRTSSSKEYGTPPSSPIPFYQETIPVKPVARDWQSKPELWAPAICQQLNAQLQQPLEPGKSLIVGRLLAELQNLLAAVLKDGSPAAWYYLYNVLGSLSPYRTLLCDHLDLLPFLEQMYHWAPQIQIQFGLDFLEVLKQVFPPDTSMMFSSTHTCCRPKKKLKSLNFQDLGPSCPFVQAEQEQRQEQDGDKNWVYPVTLSELQYALGIVGVDVAQDEAFWMRGLGLLPLAMATDIPVNYISSKEECYRHGVGARNISQLLSLSSAGTRASSSSYPTQTAQLKNQIISMLWRSKYLIQTHFIYLNLASTRHFRPYSLTVVPQSQANPEHYIFSPFGVLHVHPVEGSEIITLGIWHRHAMIWQHLQEIPFFKHFLVRRALICWRKNVKLQVLEKRRAFLENYLFHAIPHFGVCLLHINRFLQQLQSVSWLPQEENLCYTLPELQRALAKKNRGALQVLRRCLRLSAAVLQLVHEDTYRMRQGLQERVESIFEYSAAKGSMYRKWFHRQQLLQKLNRAELWWQLLGRLACLVDYMTCQNLVSILENELVTFVTCVLQAPRKVAFLSGNVAFGEDGKLLVMPSAEQMAQSLSGWLNAVVTSALEVMKPTEFQTSLLPSQATSDKSQRESRSNSTSAPIEDEDEDEILPAFISLAFRSQPNEAVRIFCGPETEMVRSRRSDPSAGPLEVYGHRIRSQYAPPSRIQLQNDLNTNHGIQTALTIQQALLEDMLLEANMFCNDHKWLRGIHQFVKNWGPQKLEPMRGWTAAKYMELLTKLDSWQSQLKGVPTMLLTKNMLLHLNFNCVQTDLVSHLADVKMDILAQVNNERYTQNQELMKILSEYVQVLQNISANIRTIAKYSQKLAEANEKSADLEERIDYVRGLNDLVRTNFGKLTLEDERLEIALIDMWETFTFEKLQASEFLLSKKSTFVPQLQEMIAAALQEMENLSIQAVTGVFMDPTQEQRSIERQLIRMERTYLSISARLAELHHAYVILSEDRKPIPTPQKGTEPILLQQRIWRLFSVSSEQISEWKCLAFSKFSTSFAWDKTDHWLTEAAKLSRLFSQPNPVIQACMHKLEGFRSYLPVLSMLNSPHMKVSGWHAIFRAMGINCPEHIEFLTLGQLLSYPLLEHRDRIHQIWMSENERCQYQETLQQLQQTWEDRQLRLLNFMLCVPYEPPVLERKRRSKARSQSQCQCQKQQTELVAKDSGTYILSDNDSLQDGIKENLQMLLKILNSPYAGDIQEKAKEWVTIFQGLHTLMEVWVVFQQKWIFLNKIIYEMKIHFPTPELSERFKVVDAQYRELMRVSIDDPLVLSLMVPRSSRNPKFQDQQLQKLLEASNLELECIITALDTVLYGVRSRFPRLFFLSDRELVALMSAPPEATEAQLWAHRCFTNVMNVMFGPCNFQSRSSAVAIKEEAHSIVGRYGEVLTLRSPLPLQHDIPKWLTCLEHWLRAVLVHGLPDCVAARLALHHSLDHVFEHPPEPGQHSLHQHARHWLELAQNFPVQCVLVAEEIAWKTQVEETLLNQKVHLLGLMQLRRLEALAHFARDQRSLQLGQHSFSPRQSLLLSLLLTGAVAHRDTAFLLQQYQVSELEDFHWARQFKYHLGPRKSNKNTCSLKESPQTCSTSSPQKCKPNCWVEVLGQPFLYSYEYLGPGQRRVVNLLHERPALGLLLALKDVACGALLGPIGMGKSDFIARLAYALGRQLVTLPCVMHIEARCLGHYLNGALQSGAWLLLQAVSSLPTGLLSALGQRLNNLRSLYQPLLQGAPEIPEMDPMQLHILGSSFFENHRVHVRFGYGCILTLDRQHSTLPPNLHSLLRPIAMAAPDLRQLSEMTLVGAGLRDGGRLASRLATFFSLEKELEPGLRYSRLPLLRQVLETTLQFLESSKDQLGPPLPRTLGATEEAALLLALLHCPLFSGPERPRLHMLRQLLSDIFPGAGNILATPWTTTPPKLPDHLVQIGLHVTPDFLSSLEQLSQALKEVPGILLMGPPGSGKSTCWQSLVKVQNQLVSMGKAYKSSKPVHTTSIYPSSLSPEEFLGWYEEHCWNHGVFAQQLLASVSQRERDPQGVEHWLVCDGVPNSAWLDPLASLLGDVAKLSLPNGQQIPRLPEIRLLLEVVNTAGMSPVIVGSCALVWCGGQQTWQAKLANLMTMLPQEYHLLPQTMTELHHLSESLVPTMLRFLNRQGATSVLHIHGQPTASPGVTEITTMTYLLRGLLNPYLHYREEEQSNEDLNALNTIVQDSEDIQGSISSEEFQQDVEGERQYRNHLLTINSFLLAFIWGFGSHLPSRFWPTYDNFIRGILKHYPSYPELPTSASVFDLQLCPKDGTLVPFTGFYLSNRIKGALGIFNPSPQAERTLYVMDLLLNTGHPVLLTGEVGSGKSTFVEVLVEPNHSCVHIPIHLALTTTQLRKLLSQEIQSQNWPGKLLLTKNSSLFLLEDLHMAAADGPRRCQPVLETLRQLISHKTLYVNNTLELQAISTTFNWLATATAPSCSELPLCSRFTRLFTVLLLGNVNRATLLARHSPGIQAWLERFPSVEREDLMARALINATVDAWEKMQIHFPPSPCHPHYHFSSHMIEHLFSSLQRLHIRPALCLPGAEQRLEQLRCMSGLRGSHLTTLVAIRSIVHLWLHEAQRTFSDRLVTANEQELCVQMLLAVATNVFGKVDGSKTLWEPGELKKEDEKEVPEVESEGELAQWEDHSSSESEDEGKPETRDLLALTETWSLLGPGPKFMGLSPWSASVTDISSSRFSLSQDSVKPEKRAKFRWQKITNPNLSGPLLLPALMLLPQERANELLFSQELALKRSAEVSRPYLEQTWDLLEKQLSAVLPQLGPGPRLSLCRPFTQHVVRLARVLAGPRQHGLLLSGVKGTGRRTALRLAAQLSQVRLFEMPLEPETSVLQCIKDASWHIGFLSQPAALMVPEGAGSSILNRLLVIAKCGCFPGQYSEEELNTIVEQLPSDNTAVKMSSKKEAVLHRFRQLVCNNLHLFILMSDGSGPPQIRPTAFLALLDLTCTSIDYYEPWNKNALISLAQNYLEDFLKRDMGSNHPRLPALQTSVANMGKVMALIHLSATKYCHLLCPLLPLATPKTFLDFLDTFLLLYFHISNCICKKIQRIQLALERLTMVIEHNNAHNRLVGILETELQDAHEDLFNCQQQLEADRMQYIQYLLDCQQQQGLIANLTKQRDLLQNQEDSITEQMDQAFLRPLAQLKVTDMDELRSYRVPPASVVMVTDALCLLFHQPPGWESARQLLGRDGFFEELVFFDKSKVGKADLQSLKQMLEAPGMNDKALQLVSQAAAGLASWLRAVLCFGMARQKGIPASALLRQVENILMNEEIRMGRSQMLAQELIHQNQILTLQVEQCRLSHNLLAERLSRAIQGLESREQVKAALITPMNIWSNLIQDLKRDYQTVSGDALLSAAAINYLGPFPPARRQEILKKWLALCAGHKVHLDPDDVALELVQEQVLPRNLEDFLIPTRVPFDLLSVLSSQPEQHQWDRELKPHAVSARFAALLLRNPSHRFARRWPLIIDPEDHASLWLLNNSQQENEDILEIAQFLNRFQRGNTTEKDTNKKEELKKDKEEQNEDAATQKSSDSVTRFKILSASDSSLGKELLEAAAKGLSVLLSNVELALDCSELQWLLQREHLCLPAVHPNFCLYLSTNLPLDTLATGLNSETLKNVNIIDLHVIPELIEEQLFQEIVRTERPELESRWNNMEINILDAYDDIETAQEKLLGLVLDTEAEQLGRVHFLRDVLCYQAEIYQRKAGLEDLKEVRYQECELQIHYQNMAHLGLTMSQSMSPLRHLHPLYPIALENCLNVTRRTLGNTDYQLTLQHGEDLDSHLQELGIRLGRRLLISTLNSLQPHHAPLVGVFGGLALLQLAGQAPALERLAFCPGLAASPGVKKNVPPLDATCPSWLEPKAWQECGLLELLPPFEGLRTSLVDHSVAWQEYLKLPSTVLGQTPGPGTTPLNLLQKLVLWRVLRPEQLSRTLADFTTCLLGRSLAEDQDLSSNPYRLSRPTRPLLVLMPPPDHFTATVHPLSFIWSLANQQEQEHLQVIGLGSFLWDPAQSVITSLNQAMRKGHWLVLDNCHLMSSWPPAILETLMGMIEGAHVISEVLPLPPHLSMSKQNLVVHKKFRLWLISSANAVDSLPVVIVQNSVPIFWEKSLELSQILIYSLYENRKIQANMENYKPSVSLTLALPVIFLHSLLLHRQLYGPWLQARYGRWNQITLETTLKTQEWIWKKFSNPWVALQELTGNIFYGGYVADPEDQAALISIVQACLDPYNEPRPNSFTPQNLLATLQPSPGLLELDAIAETETQAHLITTLFEPRNSGLTEGPQAWLAQKQSQSLWASLQQAQDLWGPLRLPSAQAQALCQVEYRLKHRVSQAIRRLKALQAMLALSSHCKTPGWNSSKGLQTVEGFLEEEGTTLGLLLLELHSDLCCLQRRLAGGLPCSSLRCEKVAVALWAGRFPPPWRRHSSTGPQPPWLWLHQLWCKGQLLTRYLSLCGQLGGVGLDQYSRSFHLSAFHHPRGLLLAIRWEASQNWTCPFITGNLSAHAISGPRQPPVCPATIPGVYPRFQLRPSYISPSHNPSPSQGSTSAGPQLSTGPGPSPSAGPQLSPRPSTGLGSWPSTSLQPTPGHSRSPSASPQLRAGPTVTPESALHPGPWRGSQPSPGPGPSGGPAPDPGGGSAPDPSGGSASDPSGGPTLSPSSSSIYGHCFYRRLGLSRSFGGSTTLGLGLGHFPSSSFSTGQARQGIEAISLHFQVECGPQPIAPEGGLLITDLLVHHAEWDPKDKALQDGHSGKPSPLPPVSVWPQYKHDPILLSSSLPLYLCPVYLGGVLGSSRLDRHHLLLHLPLPTKLSPATCAQRRVYACSPALR
ncbi:dynein heavy chain domain-containing protein 1 [Monodelphis domestica]|uniref:dynein heavy chain domain-containing protein 1 n=1 Tax=Monodelphis domestica TaxID=13616 RepID=UPI0024E231BA|nr:dynein heavy chain domain-containing protein 1 [Monodelphis domestica]